jgi:hypothetical protein
MDVYILPGGTVQTVYSDDLDLGALEEALGSPVVRRASHVEPCGLGWTADMGPSGGPVLGPFAKRGQALEAETAWLHGKILGGGIGHRSTR